MSDTTTTTTEDQCLPKSGDTPEDLTDPVIIHTDGACSGNPGPGGWAAVLERPDLPEDAPERSLELHGGDPWTTNNRMELMAPIKALECLKGTGRNVHIITDSKYVLKGITEWLPGWKARGWKTSAGKPVLNADLWERLEAATGKHRVSWEWTKGHDGNPGNERADVLARKEVTRLQRWENQPWRNTY